MSTGPTGLKQLAHTAMGQLTYLATGKTSTQRATQGGRTYTSNPLPTAAAKTREVATPAFSKKDEAAANKIMGFIAKLFSPSREKKCDRAVAQIFGRPSESTDQMQSSYEKIGLPHSEQWEKDPFEDPACPAQISPQQRKQIDGFVQSKLESWNNPSFQRTRYDRVKNGIPYTVDVFKENGKLHIMVLCKQKNTNAVLGTGASKTAKVAVDWQTGEIYADAIVSQPLGMGDEQAPKKLNFSELPGKIAFFKKECVLSSRLGESEGIAKPYIGYREYTTKATKATDDIKKAKASAYMPYYKTSLGDQINDHTLTPKAKKTIAHDLLHGLMALKNEGIEHSDLHTSNIFLEGEGEATHARIFDLGLATSTKRSGPQDYAYYGIEGVQKYASPQRQRAADLLARVRTLTKRGAAVKAEEVSQYAHNFIDATSGKNDTWSIGLMLLDILEDTIDPATKSSSNEIAGTASLQGSVPYLRSKLNSELNPENDPDKADEIENALSDPLGPDHYEALQANIDEHLSSLEGKLATDEERAIFNAAKQMLRIDPDQRITPENALDLLG